MTPEEMEEYDNEAAAESARADAEAYNAEMAADMEIVKCWWDKADCNVEATHIVARADQIVGLTSASGRIVLPAFCLGHAAQVVQEPVKCGLCNQEFVIVPTLGTTKKGPVMSRKVYCPGCGRHDSYVNAFKDIDDSE